MGILNKMQLIPYAALARQERSLLGQAWDLLRCRYGPGKLGAAEYYKFGLYHRDLSARDRRRFAGWRLEGELDRRLNPASWLGVTTDKLNQYAIFRGLGIPTPRMLAVYHPGGRHFGEVPVFSDSKGLGDYLRDGISYPFFAKPGHGSFGRGTFAAHAYDPRGEAIESLTGEKVPLAEFIAACHPREGVFPWHAGYLFQEYVAPHPSLVALGGPRLSSVRLIVLQGDRGPRLFRAVLKVATGDNVADNFEHGSKGNLLGQLDPETGELLRVVGGTGPQLREVERHPDTGRAFRGFRIPQWGRFLDLCLSGATAFPALRLQHWDIAIGADGPVVLEVNIGGDLDLPQLASGEGVLGPELAAFVGELSQTYPQIPKLGSLGATG